jgi:WhiB family redox-sensing transcriptional regulator
VSAQHGNRSKLPTNGEMAAMLRDGRAVADLAAQYGIHPQTITTRLNNAGWGQDGHPLGKPSQRLRTPLLRYPEWMDRALCAQIGGDGFYPDKGTPGEPAENAVTVVEAKRICARCPVRSDCLEYALENDERYGIWGGTSDRERRRLRAGLPMVDHDRPDWTAVREWAHEQGVPVADVGRVSAKVLEAYRAANPRGPACKDCGAPREATRNFCDPCRDRRRRGNQRRADAKRKTKAS